MRWIRPKWFLKRVFHAFFLSILVVLFVVAAFVYLYSCLPTGNTSKDVKPYPSIQLISLNEAPIKYLTSSFLAPVSNSFSLSSNSLAASQLLHNNAATESSTRKCTIFACFDIYRCGKLGIDTLSVYIYPIENIFVDGRQLQPKLSKEFYQVIDAIRNSPYYVPDPNQACIFVPTIDLTNLHSTHSSMQDFKTALEQLEYWGVEGENHLLINFFPGNLPLTDLSKASIVASTDFTSKTYRPGFHIPIISYNPLLSYNDSKTAYLYESKRSPATQLSLGRNVLSLAAQGTFSHDDPEVLFLDYCINMPLNYSKRCGADGKVYDYPEVLTKLDFCLVLKGMMHPLLWDAMSVGCIPVIVVDYQRLPFDDLIDWRRVGVLLYQSQLKQLSTILRGISPEKKQQLKFQVRATFRKYFKNIGVIVGATLETLQSRVFLHRGAVLNEWNYSREIATKRSPIFNPVGATGVQGFTAVILAYNRVPSLMQVIERVAMAPSLKKILVVWNNQDSKPPGALSWPKINKPLKIMQTGANKMSNRFYPYEDIDTEAVLALDDDIIMLTADEIEFAFQSWREFPDRIVGFPSRSHVWDNTTQRWKYESEWTNEISMVLTGVAFYHKFWHHAYFHYLPESIREWVDTKMNCEDIAMNFLVADLTGKAPLKVAPKKKFKCPTCPVNEMLSTDTGHMGERTDCINRFASIYGYMPLLPVEFRADPVLFKVDGVPNKLKKFTNIGSL